MGGLTEQQVRLLDVFALGPFLILSGLYLPRPAAFVMVTAGVLTMAYNWTRYQEAL